MPTILIDPGSYDCLNFGDLAMLQVAIARWKSLWPSASIGVITDAPEALASCAAGVTPVGVRDRALWFNTHMAGRLHQRLPHGAAARVEQIERGLKMNAARPLEAALALRHHFAGTDASGVAAFLHWIRRADVVALTGGGALTDAFSNKASHIFDTLEMAARRGRRHGRPVTAIFGQGFGPLDGPPLRSKAAEVLPRIDFIAIREGRGSRSLLRQLGVRDDRVVLTGDDAIELAYDQRRSEVGRALGVNVRVAYYAQTDASTLGVVKQAVLAAARRYGAAPVAVPISRQPGGTQPHNAEQADAVAIRELLTGVAEQSEGRPAPDTPAAVIREVGRCRVVVTGSYHGAVFALAQGIPAIGLVGSAYYRAKFLGLEEQFAGGLQVVEMKEADCGPRLEAAIDTAWQSAERVRPSLLEAAKQQIALSREAYRTVASLAERRKVSAPADAAFLAREHHNEVHKGSASRT
jgi:polysaccharide pyruvyl transferase WcaK-like protein